MSPVILFGAYIGARGGQDQDISVLFTSLILVTLLANPLIYILQTIPQIGASKGCFERLQAFLEKPEKLAHSDESIEARSPSVMPEKISDIISSPENNIVVSIENGNFGWGSDV